MTLRMLAGALALALFLAAPAAARHTYARVMCAGTWCAIVNVPDPHKDARRRTRPHERMHRASKRVLRAEGIRVRASGFALPATADKPGYGGQDGGQILPHPAGCPRVAFCGCGAAVEVFGHSVRALWLAAAWLKFPPAAPAPGMAAVRAHHVMIIREYLGDGRALVYDANSGGHRTRLHVVSLRGYRIRNPRAD